MASISLVTEASRFHVLQAGSSTSMKGWMAMRLLPELQHYVLTLTTSVCFAPNCLASPSSWHLQEQSRAQLRGFSLGLLGLAAWHMKGVFCLAWDHISRTPSQFLLLLALFMWHSLATRKSCPEEKRAYKRPEEPLRLREGEALCERAWMGLMEAMGGDALTVQLIGKRVPAGL